jgi:hypothetical protein
MSQALVSDRPQLGDVIIRRDPNHAHRYIVGSLEHRGELTYASRTDAVAESTKYALAHGVSIWQVDNNEQFTLLSSRSTKNQAEEQ